SARPIALPAWVIGESDAALRSRLNMTSSLVFWLDRRADVDGGQGSEDERLDADDDDHLEEVEEDPDRHDDDCERDALQDEDQPDERQDQDVAGEHVGEETDGQ